ncbi:MAG: serine hydrolase [Crocinitomicaceae bacterium]
MKSFFSIYLFFSLSVVLNAQNLYFPPISGNTWDTLSFSELGWCDDQLPQLYSFLDNSNTKAFIVLKDGKIVIEKYFDSFTQDSLWYWASAGKTLTAFMVGKAQEEGYLSISDTTANYLGAGWTSLTTQQEEKISIKHQLSMTSGLDDGVPDVHCTLPSCLQYLADPGTRWSYHNAPYTLLQDVVETATGSNFNVYLNSKLKVPTGMDGLFVPINYQSVYFSKPRSMARFGLLMLNNGNWDGNQVMTDVNYLNEMITPSQNLNNSYGYLWWLNGQSSFMLPSLQFVFPGLTIPNAPSDVYAGIGKNGQILNISPSRNLVVVRMGNSPDNSSVPNLYNDTIWQKLNPVICSTSSITAKVNNLEILTYPNPSTGSINIKGLDEKATLQLYSIDGRLVWRKFLSGETKQLHIPDRIPKGIYIMEISTGVHSLSKKIILE